MRGEAFSLRGLRGVVRPAHAASVFEWACWIGRVNVEVRDERPNLRDGSGNNHSTSVLAAGEIVSKTLQNVKMKIGEAVSPAAGWMTLSYQHHFAIGFVAIGSELVDIYTGGQAARRESHTMLPTGDFAIDELCHLAAGQIKHREFHARIFL